ncbi:hypothetical protein [Salipiger sp.]|uniref:DUF4376 domain-containing protein n=1 Tax=Salipiger sp. TaxID=2078585 RepID=UPI003A96F66D
MPLLVVSQNGVAEQKERDAAIDEQTASRIAAGFVHDGRTYAGTMEDVLYIQSFGMLAVAQIVNGSVDGDLRWLDQDNDFTWYDIGGVAVTFDAQGAYNLALSAAAHIAAHYRAAQIIKGDAGQSVTTSGHWP